MSTLFISLLAAFIVSLVSLVGIIFISLKEAALNKILILLIGFSAGSMMGGAFLHILPEVAAEKDLTTVSLQLLIGFGIFFILERILHWHHCHEGHCDVHAFAYTNLIGDGLHNFVDGLIIAASFVVDFRLGVATTLAVILHEMPQEISDFGVLIYAGFSKAKALFYNFLSAILAILGALLGYFLSQQATAFADWILPFAAGGFIYVAASDLIPELHKEKKLSKSLISFLLFVVGVAFMWLVKVIFS